MNNKISIEDIMDKFHDANAILEICHGYTQADQPNLAALDNVLFSLLITYEDIYEQLRNTRKENIR